MSQTILCSTTQSSFLKSPSCSSDHQLRPNASAIGFGNTQLPRPSLWTETESGSQRLCAAVTCFHETTESFYDILGISEKGTVLEIKKAYKQLARRYHPDVSPPDRVEESTKRFILLQRAYKTLSDPNIRALYDKDLSLGLHLAFSARTQFGREKVWEGKSEWEDLWQAQLRELRRQSMDRDSGKSMSWGARMRRQARPKSKASSTVMD